MKEFLDIKFKSQDLRRVLTIRDYMKELLITLWEDEEGFSGKRPFGNSGWQDELIKPLIKAKALKKEYTEHQFNELVIKLIKEM